jgi:hypothetical protein
MDTNIYGVAGDILTDRQMDMSRLKVSLEKGKFISSHTKNDANLHTSSSITWVMKSRRVRWAGHVALIGDRRGAFMVLVRRPE